MPEEICLEAGKKVHRSKETAYAQIRRLRKAGPNVGLDLHVYPCKSCRGFHVGHDSSALKKRIREALYHD